MASNEPFNGTNITTNETCPDYYPGLEKFDQVYKGFHGYLSTSVCIFGILTNVLTTIVLLRPNMRSATNYLLTGIAVADTITMTTYTIYTLYLNVFTSPGYKNYSHSKAGIVFLLFHNAVMIVSHIISTVLVVSLAAFRCRTIKRNQPASHNNAQDADTRQAKLTILITTIVTIILCIPNNISRYIEEIRPAAYWFTQYEWAKSYYTLITFILYGCFVRIFACALITIFTRTLIIALNKQRRSHLRLKAEVTDSTTRDNQRTTAMLIMVVVSFLVTEIPQGILNTVAAFDNCFLHMIYVRIGDLMDILVLFNSSLNFILYCAMSAKFRTTFAALFISRLRVVKLSGSNSSSHSKDSTEYQHIKLRKCSANIAKNESSICSLRKSDFNVE